jgi:uncharacterized membrane protein YjgN (DUF898 family)
MDITMDRYTRKDRAEYGSGETITIDYNKKPGLGGIAIKNFLLTIITLGIYRFWAKTNVRKHVWSSVHINGEPLEYTGTGKELFIGALIIFLVIFLPILLILAGLRAAGMPELALIVQLVFSIGVMFLFGMAIYRARRYRLSRTLWRGVRGTLVGSPTKYSLQYFLAMFLMPLTLGWSAPTMNTRLHKRITEEMRFGETPFGFQAGTGPLYKKFAISWFGTIALAVVGGGFFALFAVGITSFLSSMENAGVGAVITFAVAIIAAYVGAIILFSLLWSVYICAELVWFTNNTTFDNARFRLHATPFSLVKMWIGNILLLVFTLGIAAPFVVQRMVKYVVDRLDVEGWVDIGRIEQSRAPVDSHGEGLLDAFDLDAL